MNGVAFSDELAKYGPKASYGAFSLGEARRYCQLFAGSHYENFSVTSWLLPRRLRQHFCNIYAYARWADDLSDEVEPEERSRELLAWWRRELCACYEGRVTHPVFVALADTIGEFEIPEKPFADLLRAFEQDQHKSRYSTHEEVLEYCRNSANPVGLLILHLGRAVCDTNNELSDSICTGLQLANFCQDVARDYELGRIYLPEESWQQAGYGEVDFEGRVYNEAWRDLLRREVDRAEHYLISGRPLIVRVPSDFRFQIDLFVRGGLAVLREIRRAEYDVWSRRPTVRGRTKALLMVQSFMTRLGRNNALSKPQGAGREI